MSGVSQFARTPRPVPVFTGSSSLQCSDSVMSRGIKAGSLTEYWRGMMACACRVYHPRRDPSKQRRLGSNNLQYNYTSVVLSDVDFALEIEMVGQSMMRNPFSNKTRPITQCYRHCAQGGADNLP